MVARTSLHVMMWHGDLDSTAGGDLLRGLAFLPWPLGRPIPQTYMRLYHFGGTHPPNNIAQISKQRVKTCATRAASAPTPKQPKRCLYLHDDHSTRPLERCACPFSRLRLRPTEETCCCCCAAGEGMRRAQPALRHEWEQVTGPAEI